ncbi:FCD domain-containing protein [Rathayibacter sp. VKM Ac-2804]|uniref:FadR/GntR family transcriptional regulator n=1 Tax=unclassified Rathayibacter TaxID=2609250 RepID=UPI00132F3AD7|nr:MULTISPECIES: FCD domain-containing protein [unclassified Rathayibacter]NRG42232.1 FadR family transcriptional regulator [Rathayibacter sp. VKM Ac-2835]QHF22730.1 FCD domain-containing protein [Rathayibacter sp. VKM Ac-2804]
MPVDSALEASGSGRRLQRRVAEGLGREIASGVRPADSQIVPEEIGRRYDVSRTVVREAFRALEARGMIRARPRAGTQVQPESSWNLLDPDVIQWRATGPAGETQLQELLLLREAVEPAAARLFASRGGTVRREELSAAAAELALAAEARSLPRFTSADQSFHRILVEGSGNAVLAQLLGTIAAALDSRYGSGVPTFTAATDRAVDQHRRLAEAIAAGDADRAEAEARTLVRDTAEEIRATPTG